ncbi:neuromedin-S isoform X3 [Paroedura picta]|uniref:neuromedin-S isoform X3 n=1 Tax=Paroedura picta TaxID=143630 RepID=UPI004056CC07
MPKFCRRSQTCPSPMKMDQRRPPFPLMIVIYCLCTARFTSGFPQPFAGYLSESDIPNNERLALCFSQWTEQSDQPQISSSVMNLCKSMFNSMQIDEDYLDPLGRPFFLFRPRNGRTVDGGGV